MSIGAYDYSKSGVVDRVCRINDRECNELLRSLKEASKKTTNMVSPNMDLITGKFSDLKKAKKNYEDGVYRSRYNHYYLN